MLPVDFHHAGTGKHRRYAADAVYDAALLHVLTSAGFTVSAMRYLVDALTQARFALPEWKEKDPMGRRIATGALAECGCVSHPGDRHAI